LAPRAVIAAVLAIGVSCVTCLAGAGGQNEPPSVAEAGPGCSQEDFAAVIVRVARVLRDERSSIVVEIVGSIRAPRNLDLSPLRRENMRPGRPFARAMLEDASGRHVWLSGRLKIDRLDIGSVVEGAYHFRTPQGAVINGKFEAPWRREASADCG
jgi:hypothetical protein